MFEKDQWFERSDGVEIRIDDVKGILIYFVSWRPGQEYGHPGRMAECAFELALKENGMTQKVSENPEK